MIKVNEFIERREKLYRQLEDNSLLILYSGAPVKRSADSEYPFEVNRNFYYLTNIKQENSIFVVLKSSGLIKEYLFISEYDEVKEKWTGKRLTSEEARNLSGVQNILFTSTFTPQLQILFEGKNAFNNIVKVYMDLEKENKVDVETTTNNIKDSLSLEYPNIEFIDVYNMIIRLRMVKSAAEIEEFKEAISKTNIGLQKIIRSLQPGMYEYQISSLFYYTVQDYDYSELSFPTICASGVNATCLHYPTPVAKINDGDLLLLDLGAQNNLYCADISRTYPANGKFTDLQKKIYSIVLECNKLIAKSVKPGITIAQLQAKTVDFLAHECLKAKLITSLEDIKKYYFHNISHHIGLDTHDPSFRDLPLEPGNVISDEPGLYFKELGIGVRIEDDILVTEDGSYNLSNQIIKEVKDIENAFAYKRKIKDEI